MDNTKPDIAAASGCAFHLAPEGRATRAGAPSNRVRLAVVGCREGGRGACIMQSAMKLPGVDIACVCDVDSRARDYAANVVKAATGVEPRKEKDLRKVLEDASLDGILSETPDHIHAYSAVMAMKAGKAVYVEKPCCFCPEEGLVLMQVAKETGQVLQVGSQRRSSAVYRDAIQWLRETGTIGEMRWGKCWYMSNRPSIGVGRRTAVPEWLDWDLWQGPAPREDFRDNIVHYNWHWFRKWGTAEMGNNAPHFADVARWALGIDSFPESVSCSGGLHFDKGGDFEWPDMFNASFNYPGGKLITFEMTCHCAEMPYMGAVTGAMVYGTRGAAFFGLDDSVKVFDENSSVIKEWRSGDIEVATNAPISTSNPSEALDGLHLANFVEHLRAHDQATNTDAEQGVKSSMLPLLANIALDCGEVVHVDPVTGRAASACAADKWAREYEKGWEVKA